METTMSTASKTGTDSYTVGKNAAQAALDTLNTNRVDFCHVFCSSKFTYKETLTGIRDAIGTDAKLFGCSSSGEFTNNGVKTGSVTIALVTSDTLKFFTGIGTNLSTSVTTAVRNAVIDLPKTVDGYPHMAAINLHNGLTGVGEELSLTTQQKLGSHVQLVGASAGDDLKMTSTHVFCNDIISEDAVGIALIASKQPFPTAVNHGHKPISDIMTVTKADGNEIHEINRKPAYTVWKTQIREHVKSRFNTDIDTVSPDDDLFETLLNEYEFGINQGDSYKIRWPGLTTTTDGSFTFTVAIPEGSGISIMHSTPADQIESARVTAQDAVTNANNTDTPVAGAFVYDCVCRAAILGDKFEDAVAAMNTELGVPFAGFETYGEMCMQNGELSGFHNTTSVIILLPK